MSDPGCIYCEAAADDAEYTFDCHKWHVERNALTEKISKLSTNTTVERMLECKENWKAVRNFVEITLRPKKYDLDSTRGMDIGV